MYEAHFHFQARPFAAAPQPECFYPAVSIENARQTLIRVVQRAEGPGMIVGPAGVGKSLLCQMLANHFRSTFHVVLLSDTQVDTRKGLLQSILFELGLPCRERDEGELRLSLLDYLQPSQSGPHGVLLIWDEAHTLPLRLLDELRMLTNVVRDGQPRVRLILSGSAKLEEHFADPELESFNQRLAARCYLESLPHEETFRYLEAHINHVGGVFDQIFADDSLWAIHRASDGIPRLINQICDHALVMASQQGKRVNAAIVEAAWADLQQLPGPWEPSRDENRASVVEFGTLSQADEHPVTDGSTNTGHEAPAPVDPPAACPAPPATNADPWNAAEPPEADRAGAPPAAEPNPAEANAAPPTRSVPNADGGAKASDDWAHDWDAYQSPVVADTGNFLLDWPDSVDESEAVERVEAGENHEAASGDVVPEVPAGAAADLAADDVQAGAPPNVSSQPAGPGATPEEANPFGDDFEEEEIIIDRLAALEIAAFAERPRVRSPEGEELARVLQEVGRDAIECGEAIAGGKAIAGGEAGDTAFAEAAAGSPAVLDASAPSEWELRPGETEVKFERTLPEADGVSLDSAAVSQDSADRDQYGACPPADEAVCSAVVEAVVDGDLSIDTSVVLVESFADGPLDGQPSGNDAPELDPDERACLTFPRLEPEALDDRDMMVIEDGLGRESVAEPERTVSPSQRVEYHELFNQLRKT